MTPVRLEPAALRSRVKHTTTEPLRSLPWLFDRLVCVFVFFFVFFCFFLLLFFCLFFWGGRWGWGFNKFVKKIADNKNLQYYLVCNVIRKVFDRLVSFFFFFFWFCCIFRGGGGGEGRGKSIC